jgi:hypothetical protein
LKALSVTFKTSKLPHQIVESAFSRMSKGRMAQIVREANSFDQVGVYEKLFVEGGRGLFQEGTDRPADLSDFKRVRQSCPIKIEFSRKKHLGFCLESSESGAVDNPVAIGLKGCSVRVRLSGFETFEVELIVKCVKRQRPHEAPFYAQFGQRATDSG